MTFQAILLEVDQLNLVGERIEQLAEHHPLVSEALLTIAERVRSTATVLAVLVETKLRGGGDGHALTPATKPS